MSKRPFCGRRRKYMVGLLALLSGSVGCSLEEAVVDGLYGGISDTVAGTVSMVLLGLGGGG